METMLKAESDVPRVPAPWPARALSIEDLCYNAFMMSRAENNEDGGPTDWMNDTKPVLQPMIDAFNERIVTLENDNKRLADSYGIDVAAVVADLKAWPESVRGEEPTMSAAYVSKLMAQAAAIIESQRKHCSPPTKPHGETE